MKRLYDERKESVVTENTTTNKMLATIALDQLCRKNLFNTSTKLIFLFFILPSFFLPVMCVGSLALRLIVN